MPEGVSQATKVYDLVADKLSNEKDIKQWQIFIDFIEVG